jgi:hypothetical protein
LSCRDSAGFWATFYNFFKDYAATVVLIACAIAAYRRAVVKPARYAVPAKYGKDHTAEALFVLGLISTLMISESLFEASSVAANTQAGLHAEFLAPASLAWFVQIRPAVRIGRRRFRPFTSCPITFTI